MASKNLVPEVPYEFDLDPIRRLYTGRATDYELRRYHVDAAHYVQRAGTSEQWVEQAFMLN